MQAWLPAPAPKLLHVLDQPTTEVLSQELLWSSPGDSGHCSPFPDALYLLKTKTIISCSLSHGSHPAPWPAVSRLPRSPCSPHV